MIGTTEWSCPNCNAAIQPADHFCGRCGGELTPAENNGVTPAPTGAGAPVPAGAATLADQPAETPADQPPPPRYMGFWIRFIAIWIDLALVFSTIFLLPIITGWDVAAWWDEWWGNILLSLIWYGYAVTMTAWQGQTLGKMFVGVRVVDHQGQTPSLSRVLVREIPGKLIANWVLFIGSLWAGWDREKQGWHDHIAHTWVVGNNWRQSPLGWTFKQLGFIRHR